MPKVVLDAEAFKVLASDTRLAILKGLDGRPKTVSELGRELDLNKATVFEHLKSLMAGDLVKKQEREGRKWVYYTLTWKGKSLLHPENTTVMVLLGLGLMGSTAALMQLGNLLRWWGMPYLLEPETEDPGQRTRPEGTDEAAPTAEETSGAQSDDADSADGAENQMFADDAAQDDAAADGSAADDGGSAFLELWDEPAFWWFALFFVVGMAALVAAGIVRYRAHGQAHGVVAEAAREAGEREAGGRREP